MSTVQQRYAEQHSNALSTIMQSGRLRRSTLVMLRWMAVAGQSLALLIVAFVLKYELPTLTCFLMIALSAIFNIIVTISSPLDRRVNDKEAMIQLGFDVLQLAVLLWLTGGMMNPFSLLFVAPVVTSATTLSRSVFIGLSILTIMASFTLLYSHHPLPWKQGETFTLPHLYKVGNWSALIVSMIFTALYAWRVAIESRRMSEALSATEAVLAHEQKLSALGGLAAAAAHELGTPLATIQLTAKEMQREIEEDSPLLEDLNLVISQTNRCRDILKQLSHRGDEGDIIHDNISLGALMEQAASPYRNLGVVIEMNLSGDGPEPVVPRKAELIYGLKNFIENAVGFADEKVELSAHWSPQQVCLSIGDDGPGFDLTVLDRLGEPFVSGRHDESLAGGMGLGFFISKTLLERTGAHLRFGNVKNGGAKVEIIWPDDMLSLLALKTHNTPYNA